MEENLLSTNNGGGGGYPDVNMVSDVNPASEISWKDKLFSGGSSRFVDFDTMECEDFTFSKGDI
ncbi:hypothetical protein Goshw_021967 [Gossypium schwendimanii]|uniref:Uncharacterized protein n=1 Tax=Gossypium schwendimanii TaxID=34291 RepID=A0A7J9LII6_GOSSC|nr:hypothetical protein [Gossypium schwendimanii]